MASFTAGTTFSDGVANDVTAAKLGVLVTNATPTSGFIQDRTAETVIASNDTVLIGDASDSNNLKRITVDNLMKAEMTGNINSTSGTIQTLTSSTATITGGTFSGSVNSTTGTISTFNSTTGTIPTLVATTLITTGAGTVTAPAISPTGDSNNGLFFPAADTIAATTNGTERIRITSGGQVGIGTTSPARQLTLDHASNPEIGLYTSGTERVKLSTGGTAVSQLCIDTGGTERLRIDSSGNVLVGITSTTFSASGRGLFEVNGSTDSLIALKRGGTAGLYLYTSSAEGRLSQVENLPLTLYTNNLERLRITSGGLVLIGATSDGGNEKLRVEGSNDNFITRNVNSSSNAPEGVLIQFTAKAPNNTSQHYLYCSDTGAVRMTIRSNGGIANYQANNVNLSDERIKEGIQPSPSYLDKICSIPVVNFKYKDQTHDDYNLGVIAQQVESVCPELVDSDGFGETPNDGEPLKSIYQTDLQYALMKCIQELKAENDNLKARIEALEAA